MRNIVLITSDALRADHCSFMGYKRETTPNLDKMAREGLCFENAYSPSSRTLPSMVGVLTGDLITQYTKCDSQEAFGKNGRLNIKRKKTLAEALSEKGYTTGAFNPNAYASRYFGFDKGFDYFQDFLLDADMLDRFIKSGKSAYMIRNIKNFVQKKEAFKTWEGYYHGILSWVNNAKQPFFLWVFLLDTHFPFLPRRPYRKWTNLFDMYYYNWKFYKTLTDKKVYLSEKGKHKIEGAHDSALYYTDHFLGCLLQDLMDYDPVIIFHADHGESFGEKGLWGHGHFRPTLYEENIHVPLVVYNGNEKGRIEKPVSLVDLYPALLGFADGNKLSSPLMGNDWVLSKDIDYVREGKEVFSVRLRQWKFITGQNETDELYNLKEDPNEQENLINEHGEFAKEMRGIIESSVDQQRENRRIRERVSRLKAK